MVLVIGGAFSGRGAFAGENFGAFHRVSDSETMEFEAEGAPAELSRVVERLSSFPAVVATEMGCGIVPLEEKDRLARERNGRLNCALASCARCVVLMSAGVPTVIKGSLANSGGSGFLLVFRHGQTESNVQRRFAGGLSDVPLTPEGVRQAVESRSKMAEFFSGYERSVSEEILKPERIFVSPMLRAQETARILFPESEIETVEDFREMRMGLFENMTHEELLSGRFADGSECAENAAIYQNWLDSGGTLPTPSGDGFFGESRQSFADRVCAAFGKISSSLQEGQVPVVVAHGGVQMALCETFFFKAGKLPLHAWQSDNAMYRFGDLK